MIAIYHDENFGNYFKIFEVSLQTVITYIQFFVPLQYKQDCGSKRNVDSNSDAYQEAISIGMFYSEF